MEKLSIMDPDECRKQRGYSGLFVQITPYQWWTIEVDSLFVYDGRKNYRLPDLVGELTETKKNHATSIFIKAPP
ncbi:MAG: hypothetical protein IPN26_17685 [Bacteroidetes bacterium]|nr:hypothetical protein [Bacteroidota bacterium]